MNLDNISEADLDRLLEALWDATWAGKMEDSDWSFGRQIIREWLESLGDE